MHLRLTTETEQFEDKKGKIRTIRRAVWVDGSRYPGPVMRAINAERGSGRPPMKFRFPNRNIEMVAP